MSIIYLNVPATKLLHLNSITLALFWHFLKKKKHTHIHTQTRFLSSIWSCCCFFVFVSQFQSACSCCSQREISSQCCGYRAPFPSDPTLCIPVPFPAAAIPTHTHTQFRSMCKSFCRVWGVYVCVCVCKRQTHSIRFGWQIKNKLNNRVAIDKHP